MRICFSSDQTRNTPIKKHKKHSKEFSPSATIDAREQETSETTHWASKITRLMSHSPPRKMKEIKSSLVNSDGSSAQKNNKSKYRE